MWRHRQGAVDVNAEVTDTVRWFHSVDRNRVSTLLPVYIVSTSGFDVATLNYVQHVYSSLLVNESFDPESYKTYLNLS